MEPDVLIDILQFIYKPLNIVSDSAYVVGLFPAIEAALILSSLAVILPLLQELQYLVKTSTYPLFVTHTLTSLCFYC